MSSGAKQLCQAVMTTGASTHYTVETGKKVTITEIRIYNSGATEIKATVNLVNSGGARGAINQILTEHPVAAKKSWKDSCGTTLHAGGTIQALCDTGSVVGIMVSGILENDDA